MRAGLLCQQLAKRSHQVTWWTPDFEHYSKVHRTGRDATIQVSDGYRIRLMKSLGYQRHVGVRRLAHNYLLAKHWTRLADAEPVPDLILCAWPTPDLTLKAIHYGTQHSIPVVIDVRDLWPDLWLEVLPRALRPLGRLGLVRYSGMARWSFARATCITGITSEYVDWGVRQARRKKIDLDRAFELGFQPAQPDQDEVAKARDQLLRLGYSNDERLNIVFAGTFGRSFEFETVIEAAKLTEHALPGRIRFVLCGSGDQWQRIAGQAKGVPSVQVLPRLSIIALQEVYKDSILGIAPYRNIENFQKNIPNKINEYLRMDLPILSGVDGRISNLIESNGIGKRYEAGNAESLARTVRDLATDPEGIETMRERIQAYRMSSEQNCDGTNAFADHVESIIEANRGKNPGSASRGL